MGAIRVGRVVAAPLEAVWAELADLPSHVEWMADARSLDFHGDQREGVGTTFDCLTVVGPLRLHDRMEVTRWEPPYVVAVEHRGLVTGAGAFSLVALGPARTEVQWAETLRYPLGPAGAVAGVVGDRVLRRIWRGNLERLAARAVARAR